MEIRRPAAAALLAASLVNGPLHAQAIYRCGDSYGSQSCDGAKALPPAGAEPSAAERARAESSARRDAALAGAMEKDRLRQEAQAAQAPAAFIPPSKADSAFEPHRWPEKAGTRKLDVFTASAPGTKKPKDKPKAAKKAKAASAPVPKH